VLLQSWAAELWGPECSNSPPEHLHFACRQVERVVEAAALSVCHALPDLAEFFFNLPRVNRDVLECGPHFQLPFFPIRAQFGIQMTLTGGIMGISGKTSCILVGSTHCKSVHALQRCNDIQSRIVWPAILQAR
jgi:hypothetical protein